MQRDRALVVLTFAIGLACGGHAGGSRPASAEPPDHPDVDDIRGSVGRRIEDSPPGSRARLIRDAIRSHGAEVEACYEQWLAAHPGIGGTVKLRWTIDAYGRAKDARVLRAETTLPGEEVPACIIARLATWEFPRPAGGGPAVVGYPWRLQPARTSTGKPSASGE